MNTKNQKQQEKDRQQTNEKGYKQDDQQKQNKKSAFDEGLMDNSGNQPINENGGQQNDPEIDTPVYNPGETEKKIPKMKGDQ